MKLGDFMAGRTPNPDHSGFSNADDMVLAVGLGSAAAEPNDYTAAVVGITEASGALDAQTQDANYLYTGPVSIKTGTSRTFTGKRGQMPRRRVPGCVTVPRRQIRHRAGGNQAVCIL